MSDITPLRAVRLKCLDCCLGQAHEVRLCPCKDCPLYPYRFGRKPKDQRPDMTPLKAIRARCLDCSAFSPKEVRECPIKSCPTFVYRIGTNPKRAGLGNPANLVKRKPRGVGTLRPLGQSSNAA